MRTHLSFDLDYGQCRADMFVRMVSVSVRTCCRSRGISISRLLISAGEVNQKAGVTAVNRYSVCPRTLAHSLSLSLFYMLSVSPSFLPLLSTSPSFSSSRSPPRTSGSLLLLCMSGFPHYVLYGCTGVRVWVRVGGSEFRVTPCNSLTPPPPPTHCPWRRHSVPFLTPPN